MELPPERVRPVRYAPARVPLARQNRLADRRRTQLQCMIGAVAFSILSSIASAQAPPSLAPEDATPTTNTDVSSFIATGCGYDAWTGSARRVVHDIFPVAGSMPSAA